jgi:hypothetical protein
MTRIKESDLEAVLKRINLVTKSPLDRWVKKADGGFIAQVGNYHLDFSYGLVALYRVSSESGAVENVLGCLVPKRELYGRMHAYLRGLYEANRT